MGGIVKKSGQLKTTVLLLVYISILFISVFAINENWDNTKPPINDITAVNIISYTDYYDLDGSTITDHNGLSFITNENGMITLKKNNTSVGSFYFVFTGTINGLNHTYRSTDFNWTWSIYEDITNNDYILTGNNNKSGLNWIQEYHFFGDDRKIMKITHTIGNDLGVPITNTKFWYINNIKIQDTIRFNQIDKILKHNENINIKQNIYDTASNSFPRVDINHDYFFSYQDMIQDSNSTINLYMGDGLLIGLPKKKIMGVGFDKGTLNPGARLVIDPSVGSCQTLAESNENYILNQTIWNAAGFCFIITGNYTTFDLNGHTIDGVDYSGVAVESDGTNVTIKNGIVQEFSLGVRTLRDNNTVYNVTSRNNSVGIDIVSNYNTVFSNILEENIYAGIRVPSGKKNNVIISNTLTDNTNDGILFMYGPSNNTITLNTITGGNRGIYLYPENNNNTITFNNVSGSTRAIYLSCASDKPCSYNIISNNQISSSGIELTTYTFNNTGSANCGGVIIDNGVDNNVTNASCGGPTTDLEILEVIPIQVVKDVDMVKGKTTLVRAIINNTGSTNENVTIKLYFEGSLKDTVNDTLNAGQDKNIDLYFVPDIAGSNKEIEVTVGVI